MFISLWLSLIAIAVHGFPNVFIDVHKSFAEIHRASWVVIGVDVHSFSWSCLRCSLVFIAFRVALLSLVSMCFSLWDFGFSVWSFEFNFQFGFRIWQFRFGILFDMWWCRSISLTFNFQVGYSSSFYRFQPGIWRIWLRLVGVFTFSAWTYSARLV